MPAPAVAALRRVPVARHAARRRRRLLVASVAAVTAMVLVPVVLLVLLAGGLRQSCAGGPPAETWRGPGSLGGVAGTGLTAAQIEAVRGGSPYAGARVTRGRYEATAYGPPWGGIQGAGQTTSGGLVIAGGAPRWYMLAVDPLVIGHGTLVYVWPNPFRWRGPFLAADTGGAIRGRRIDVYDWRGRRTQNAWGRRAVRVAARPIVPGGPAPSATAPLAGGDCGAAGDGVGQRIGRLARAQLGRGPHIPGFTPPAAGYAWCAGFATNVWRQAGVPIRISAWSGYPYAWARERGQLFKAVGRPPRGGTPPVGAALMYGRDPTRDSLHVNLVDTVLADGSFMVTGGNQDDHRVTREGPCRLHPTDPAALSGPGCDPRPIYGIATPTRTAG
jgi:3D (Asp-Asp-Asp) domain-containing protein